MRALLLKIAAASVLCMQAAHASLSISNHPTHNVNCVAGVCTPTAKKAVLNAGDLSAMLSGGDVKVTTGAGAVTIEVTASLAWTAAHRLTLDAIDNVSIKAPVAVEGTGGALTMAYNDGGTDGDLKFFDTGKVVFWDLSSSLIINGASFVLVSSLKQLSKAVKAAPMGFYALANDYDAAADGTYSRSIIKTLKGIVEGLGHSILNLTVATSAEQSTGFIDKVARRAALRDLGLENAKISGDGATGHYPMIIGGVAAVNDGLLDGVYLSGSVSAGGSIWVAGGLAGQDNGTITNSHSSANFRVKGSPHIEFPIGGLAGEILVFGGTISNSFATGSVTSENSSEAGGLAGFSRGVIQNSYATGAVIASDNYPAQDQYGAGGGLVGDNRGNIETSYATGAVSATGSSCAAGGLVGFHSFDALSTEADIKNSYATGPATGKVANCWTGGLAGVFISDNGATIGTSYSIGAVTGGVAGGFIGGSSDGGKSNDNWDQDTSGKSEGCGDGSCSGVTGLSDAQLKAGLPAGFDPAIWGQNASINNGYPYLLANPPPQ